MDTLSSYRLYWTASPHARRDPTAVSSTSWLDGYYGYTVEKRHCCSDRKGSAGGLLRPAARPGSLLAASGTLGPAVLSRPAPKENLGSAGPAGRGGRRREA